MLSGPVTGDTLNGVLRVISRRQRNGELTIQYEQGEMTISFQEGRIVGVEKEDESAAVAICQRLVAAGYLKDKIVTLVGKSGVAVAQLYELLVGKQYVSRDEFVRTKSAYELDLLHSLRALCDGEVNFAPRLVRADPRLSISIYPGQILLDIAELGSDEPRFNKLFEGLESTSCYVQQMPEASSKLTEPERIVFDAAYGGSTPKEIFERSLLSQYDAMEALLSLHDQEMIGISSSADFLAGGEVGELNREAQAAQSASLSGTISDDPDLQKGEEPFVQDPETAEEVKERVDSAVHLLKEMSGEELFDDLEEEGLSAGELTKDVQAGASAESCVSNAQVLSSSKGSPSSFDEESTQQRTTQRQVVKGDSQGSEALQDTQSSAARSRSLGEIIHAANYFMLREPAVRITVVLITLIYLFVLALYGPNLFEAWFGGLSDFTSNS